LNKILKTYGILAVIPARGGSKGLLRKNILDLGGKPMIAWTIEASLRSKYITKTVVSSDSDEILAISKEYGASVLKRPDELSDDTSSSESVVKHAIDGINGEFDLIILLQPTSPLRDSFDIDSAIEKMLNESATALISGFEIDNTVLEAFKEGSDGYIEGISNNSYPFMRRQDLPITYMSNGAIYIIQTNKFLKGNSFYTKKTVMFVMDKVKSLEIDTKEDFNEVKSNL
jgi:CMP-N-acetylneuraminic acid synthetase